MFDVAIVGSGPAGAACAAFCARAGLNTLVLERESFPREKVCGDCLNPACWPVLRGLELAQRVRALPHGRLDDVEFIGINGRTVRVPLPAGDDAEIAVKRSLFDHLIMTRARELGATVHERVTVTALSAPNGARPNWTITAGDEKFESRVLVAADGRNSTVARLCNLLPRIEKERIALQAHIPLPNAFGDRVILQFLPGGYSGQAPVGEGKLNLCLVSTASNIVAMRRWAERRFKLSPEQTWRSTTPLTRAPIACAQRSLFLIGDVARVVEPFTGEGISYALNSAELAAGAIVSLRQGVNENEVAQTYAAAQARLYRGRLWVNRLARAAVLSPRLASAFLQIASFQPAILRFLTGKIVRL